VRKQCAWCGQRHSACSQRPLSVAGCPKCWKQHRAHLPTSRERTWSSGRRLSQHMTLFATNCSRGLARLLSAHALAESRGTRPRQGRAGCRSRRRDACVQPHPSIHSTHMHMLAWLRAYALLRTDASRRWKRAGPSNS
jgi:predicted  nucleic acid-binding Zn-ribbon protein